MVNGNNNSESLDDRKYQNPDLGAQAGNMPGTSAKDEKEMQKVREKLESLKKFICTKYKATKAIGIIHPQAAGIFDEENELNDEEKKEKPMHLFVIMPDDKEKDFNNIKAEIIKKIKETKQKIWLIF